MKEKCIYYNPIQKGYYIVLSIDDEMIYGRRGDYVNTSNLEDWINQDGPGLGFKIDDIIIYRDYIRNYYLDEKCLDQFELVKELSDEEFYPVKLLIESKYKFPNTIIDVNKHMLDVTGVVSALRYKQLQMKKLEEDISDLEKRLFSYMEK